MQWIGLTMRTLLLMSLAVPSDDWASACMCRATRKAEADRALLRDEIDASIMDETGLSVVAALSRSASACSASTAAPLEATEEARAAAHSSAHAARASVSSAATSRAHSLCASQSASVAVGRAWSIRLMSAEICALTSASVAASRSILRTVNQRRQFRPANVAGESAHSSGLPVHRAQRRRVLLLVLVRAGECRRVLQ